MFQLCEEAYHAIKATCNVIQDGDQAASWDALAQCLQIHLPNPLKHRVQHGVMVTNVASQVTSVSQQLFKEHNQGAIDL